MGSGSAAGWLSQRLRNNFTVRPIGADAKHHPIAVRDSSPESPSNARHFNGITARALGIIRTPTLPLVDCECPMISNSFNVSSALTAYVDSLRAKTQADTTAGDKTKNTAAGNTSTKATTATKTGTVSNSVLNKTPASFKTTQARHDLDKAQLAVAKDIKAALTKAGTALKGEVSFSVDAKGALTISGSAEDKAAVAAALKADTSSPSLASRITSLSERAETVESNSRRSAAIMQAARHAGHSSNLMSLYTSLMTQQGEATASFSMSDKASQMVFKGMVDSTA